jgi:HAE1 family hydrophobic/amphiphilic exporter-1
VNLSAIAIRRPVLTVMTTLGLLVMGFVGLGRLGTDLFPDVAFPVVMVTVPYPGASPSEVENLVSKPIEDAVISLNGIDRVRSFAREGVSITWVMFKLGTDLPDAATQVRERVAQARGRFPGDAKDPVIGRFDVAGPVLVYALKGGGSLSAARKFADDVLKPELEQVSGVGAINVTGSGEREIQVALDRSRLDALNLSPAAVVARLKAENLNVPAGRYDEGVREISVRTVGELADVGAVRDVIVATAPDGSAVRLGDVAHVVDGFAEQRTLVRVNGVESVTFDVVKQSGQNTIEVGDAVKARLAGLAKRFPPGMETTVVFDQSRFVRNSVDQVKHDLFIGGVMAILVILVFMLDLRSTLISSVALPTSVIGTFFIMYLFGYTLNMMTLLALSLAIGLLIDDAVVVRENIFKHLERGVPPRQAALDGTKEIALAVLATTATIVAVFLPVAFVEGQVGQFFRQFGTTVSAAVVLSLFVAFTLDPMLSSRFSKSATDKHEGAFTRTVKRPFQWFFTNLEGGYRLILGWALRHKLITGVLAVGTLVLMKVVAGLTGNEFVSSEDRGQFVVEAEMPAGTSLAETSRLSALAEDKLRGAEREIETVFATIGPQGEVNKARWRVLVTPKNTRPHVAIANLKEEARRVVIEALPDAKVVVTDPPFIEGAATEAPIMIMVRGETYDDIVPLSNKVGEILRTTPGVQDVQVKYTPGRPELQVSIDRRKAADRGLPVAPLALAVRTAMDGEEAGRLRQGQDEIPIVVRLRAEDRQRPDDLANLTIPTMRGSVKLGDVATFRRGEGPQVIERENRGRQIPIWASPIGRPLGDIVKEIQPRLDKLELPAGASLSYDGQIRFMNENNEAMALTMGLGILFIFIILASQFESFIHPLTIMVTLPLAIVGAILGLFLTGNTMAMGALIGMILLMGLVTKNAILLVDRAIVRVRDHGEPPMQAILEAGPERLRPILMTSTAMSLGMLPTAIGNAEGSEFRAPMAIAVIGGVISSTLLSLVVVPVVYLTIENIKAKLGSFGSGRRRRARATVTGSELPAVSAAE